MKNKINVAELLKDCPTGMELNCTMYEDCKFLDIDVKRGRYLIRITTPCGTKYLDKYGCYTSDDKAKCVIFPKGKTTWDGFVPPCKFKDGDIISSNVYVGDICIFKKEGYFIGTNDFYCGVSDKEFIIKDNEDTESYFGDTLNYRLATEEEKHKLFDAIKENGYYWNKYKKTLGTLVKPKFKVGDKIRKIKNINEERIINEVTELTYVSYIDTYHNKRIPIKSQDVWELIPDKFDISTLEPFESKVLVRNTEESIWKPSIFGCYVDKTSHYYVLGGTCWSYCIPYEGNEHLRGKTDDCDEYYKTWEE